ncbi:MAG TPA: hypothetical protein VEQ66_08565 [Propionibacteriaceae bacterium]|nr:hypothetical protein [Propionibacteriaceae bacterium]
MTVVGQRQVADAPLMALARAHQATLVTFDLGLVSAAPTDTWVPSG